MLMVSSLAVLGSRKDLKREMSSAGCLRGVVNWEGKFLFFFFWKNANLGATWIFARVNLLSLLCLANSMCRRRISDFAGQVVHCPC